MDSDKATDCFVKFYFAFVAGWIFSHVTNSWSGEATVGFFIVLLPVGMALSSFLAIYFGKKAKRND